MTHPLTSYRAKVGASQTELAARVGTAASYISQIETGFRRPSIEMAKRIAAATGLPISDLRPDLREIFEAVQS